MQRPPHHELPRRAVPDAAEQHRQHQVAVGFHRSVPVAAERYVEVIAQPVRQRDVPALPEFAQPLGPVRLVEIGRKAEAEQRRQRDRDIGVGAEIAIDLHRIAVDAEQQIGPAIVGRRGEDRIDQPGREVVRDDDLLEQPEQDQQQRRRDRDRLGRGPRQLRQEIGGAHDRPGDELREKRHVQRHVERLAAHRDIAAIHIHDIRDAVKREKADADRQQDFKKRQLVREAERARQLVGAEHKKIEILEDAEQRQMHRRPRRQE